MKDLIIIVVVGFLIGIISGIIKSRRAAAAKAQAAAEAAERRAKAEAERKDREAQREIEEQARRAEREEKRAAREMKQRENGEQFSAMTAEIPRAEIVPAASDIVPDADPDFFGVKYRNVTASSSLEKLGDFVAVDVETTGLRPENAEIVQIAAVTFRGFEPVEAFVTYVNPKNGIREKAKAVNGITEEMVAGAPQIEEIVGPFRAFIGEKQPIVGHNLPFDVRFLVTYGCLSLEPKRPFFDTLELARKVYDSSDFSLDYLMTWALDTKRPEAHDALSDAVAAGQLFRAICEHRTKPGACACSIA